MAFSAAARRKAKDTQAANREAKKKEHLPATVELTELQAMRVISKVAETGDMLEACKMVQGVTFADVIIWIRAHSEWVNAMDVALTTYAQQMALKAIDVADEPIPWAEMEGWEIEAKKLYLDAWAKRQKGRVEAMRGYADRIAPKAPSGPAAVVNVDARKTGDTGYAAMLKAVEHVERTKLIEHREEG